MSENINKEIGKRIKNRRKELKLTQQELANRMGLKDRSVITYYEKGEKTFKQSQIVILAEALGTTPSFLMGWDDEEKKTLEYQQIWDENIGNPNFTLEELYELINFAKYLISKR